MASMPVIEFCSMAVIRWKGWYICCDEECPENNGEPHVWATKTKPRHNATCGKCKRITWNRKDERFTKSGRPKGKRKRPPKR